MNTIATREPNFAASEAFSQKLDGLLQLVKEMKAERVCLTEAATPPPPSSTPTTMTSLIDHDDIVAIDLASMRQEPER